jgi:protein-S-isoprenylcysteine O-methyltransferase Ste14
MHRVGVVRHLLAIVALPGNVAIVVPAWIRAAHADVDSRWPDGAPTVWIARSASLVLLAAGLVLFAWCVALFAREGRGTLAPWDPTRRFVLVGPYRHVRNPMISGVAMLLAGQALWSGSWMLALWLVAFVAVNHVFFVLVEEPGLVARFGDAYRTYVAHVPRWLPRRTPWRDEN